MESSVEVAEVFGVPCFGGSVSALCVCEIDAEVTAKAAGEPIYLASRSRQGSSEVMTPGGIRSAPLPPGSGRCSAVVPLPIPADTGECGVEIDLLVEGKFWGSSVGVQPALLNVKRRPEQGVCYEDARNGKRHYVSWAGGGGEAFRIPHSLYGAFETERCVEIPWVLSRHRGESRVLDIGSAHAEPRYLDALSKLRIPLLVALDLVPCRYPGVRSVVADARWPPLGNEAFDLILAVSVIEHIGCDNRSYVGDLKVPTEPGADCAALRALAEVLRPGGRILMTVPFGAAEDHGWFVQYDQTGLDQLLKASGLAVVEKEFYTYAESAWGGPLEPARLVGCRYGVGAAAASAVACVTLMRAPLSSKDVGGLR